MSTDLGTAGEMESRELVHFVTQQTRFALINNNILQHPEQLPSMYELEGAQPQRERGHRLQAHSEAHRRRYRQGGRSRR